MQKYPRMLKFGMEYLYAWSKTVFYSDKRDDNSLRDNNACLFPRRMRCNLMVGWFKQNNIHSKKPLQTTL